MQVMNTALNRRLIRVRYDNVNGHQVPLSEFLTSLEAFTNLTSEDNEIIIHAKNGAIEFEEVRLETSEEYDTRIAEAKAHEFAVKQAADKTWRKQQARFAKARRNK